jgi:hypothetical protein
MHDELDTERIEKWATPTFLLVIDFARKGDPSRLVKEF